VDPTLNDDRNDGYYVGTVWINTVSKQSWILVDSTGANAVWNRIDDTGATSISGTDSNNFILDQDNTGGNVTLQFGATLAEYLRWDSVNSKFVFSADVDLEGNQLKNFRLDNLDIAPTCNALVLGRAYYNTTDNNTYVCNGFSWTQLGGLAGGIFGTSYTYAESVAESINNATIYQQKLRLTTPSLPAGNYRISWFYNWSHGGGNNNFLARVQVDDTTGIFNHTQEPQDTAAGQANVVSGFIYTSLTAGAHNIDLDFASSSNGSTARMSNARLEIYRVN
jgi:hypothetical protein